MKATVVDHGPSRWDDRDVWTEIEDHLKQNDVRAGASLLRHYLEYTSAELCHRLRVPVEFRGDVRYQLGGLLPPAIAHLRKLYGKGKDAASSWNQGEVVQQIASRVSEFAQLATASNAEQWQVNVAVLFNSWDNLGRDDFARVVTAFRNLLTGFTCTNCGEYLRVVPDRETAELVQCGCGKANFGLRKKGA